MEGAQAPEDPAAARAAEQARLRKERREAKIKAGGAARLNKITGLGGGIQRDPQPSSETPQATTTSSDATTTSTPAVDSHGDPEEVDISQHYYEPNRTPRQQSADTSSDISQAQLRQMMLDLNAGNTPPPTGGPVPPGMEGMEQDPMMQMLTQVMSGGPGGPGGNPFAGTPMESLLGGLGNFGGNNTSNIPGAVPNPMQQAQAVATNKTANLWRILHAVFALGLGLYVALSTTFTGSLTEREHSAINTTKNTNGSAQTEVDSIESARAYFFYVFASVEAVLLTTRFFLDKKRDSPAGWMWTVTGFLPPPVKGFTQHALRYGQILSTVRSDALVCVFVLGVCSWFRS
ncbi:uncharacterized protein F4822DRAFT_402540 [Hypoxylon trugodes]|uniref:uncharacterized protein n=1 Tax=Hypoxylon trugodes TaxID=326681 RepID=UPI002190B9DA|nr:uncharacterized protein F4822DRAFT_402540 [Hypoxylon trugodes]KAI1388330.1 hypothetical protein F4822DRAFT_402540 [Hypoxylon trugodes]